MTERPRGGSTRDRVLSFLLARLTDDTVQASRMAVIPAGTGGRHFPAVCAPGRLLREIAAKRAIIQLWLAALRAEEGSGARWPHRLCDPVYTEHPEFDRRWSSPGWGEPPPPDSAPLRRAPASGPAVPEPRRRFRMIKP